MKRLILGLVCCMLLCSCGTKTSESASLTQETAQSILDSGVFTDQLDELDCDTAWALYGFESQGLERSQLSDGLIRRSAGATCEELAFLTFEDEDSAALAVTAMENYLQSQIDRNKDYRPKEIPKLENAVLQHSGSNVLLVVSADCEGVNELLQQSPQS